MRSMRQKDVPTLGRDGNWPNLILEGWGGVEWGGGVRANHTVVFLSVIGENTRQMGCYCCIMCRKLPLKAIYTALEQSNKQTLIVIF